MSVDIDMPVRPELSEEETRFDRGMRLTAAGLAWCFAAVLVMVLGPILLANIGLTEKAAEKADIVLSVVVAVLHCVGCVLSCGCPGSVVRGGRRLIITGMTLFVVGVVLFTWLAEKTGAVGVALMFIGMAVWLVFLWRLAKNSLSEEIAAFALSLVILVGGSGVLALTPFVIVFFFLMPWSLLAVVLELILYGGLLLGLRTRILQRTDSGWKAEEEEWLS